LETKNFRRRKKGPSGDFLPTGERAGEGLKKTSQRVPDRKRKNVTGLERSQLSIEEGGEGGTLKVPCVPNIEPKGDKGGCVLQESLPTADKQKKGNTPFRQS